MLCISDNIWFVLKYHNQDAISVAVLIYIEEDQLKINPVELVLSLKIAILILSMTSVLKREDNYLKISVFHSPIYVLSLILY